MGPGRPDLARRVEARLLQGMDAAGVALRPGRRGAAEPSLPPPPPGRPLLVACSGGPDSLVLLHLLRFGCRGLPPLRVAHLDHGMRRGSAADARWLAGVCASWELPLHTAELSPPPTSEGEARTRRHAWLEALRQEVGASRVLLAHHADDQVETVLFRAVRGTGVQGLRGMDAVRLPALLRPLLAEPAVELRAWARRHHLRGRIDPTNLDPAASRNRLRHRVLPELEATHPGARAALARLGRRARAHAAALDALLETPLETVVERATDQEVVVAREAFLAYAFSVRTELLHRLAGRLGIRLAESGTLDAVEFIATGRPGGRLPLPGGGALLLAACHFVIEGSRR
ncbi:MAG: tRNA lysidine(34) synthetase TilS [Gemmatimonadales bacterium]|nr:MAG: tRNA lysidine(34) synthetase TilS [Gemmatimonadales bacterium]